MKFSKICADLNKKFADIVRRGEIIQGVALRQEKSEPEIRNLPRLVLTPYRHSFGRFRQLIDAITARFLLKMRAVFELLDRSARVC